MATLKVGPFQGCARVSSLLVAVSDSGSASTANSLSFRNDFIKLRKWECPRLVVLASRAITSVEDEKPAVGSSQTIINRTLEDSKVSRKDLSILPSKFNKHMFLHVSKFLCIGVFWRIRTVIYWQQSSIHFGNGLINMITKLVSSVVFLGAKF